MENFRGQMSRPVMVAAGLGFLLGLFIGLVVLGWWLMPVQWTDASPSHLSAAGQEEYLRMAMDSYRVNADATLAKERMQALGSERAGQLVEQIRKNPQGLSPELINEFARILKGEIATPTAAPEKPTPTPATSAPTRGNLTIVLGLMCLLTLLIGGILAYLFLFRNRQSAGGGGGMPAINIPGFGPRDTARSAPAEAVPTADQGAEPPIVQYMTTYSFGNDLYDDSFSVDSQRGDFLGECGVSISDTIGVGEPKKVTAFEVWLFDKNDIQTVTRVLMSEHAINDAATRQRLASKGEPEQAGPGKRILLETASLRLEGRVVAMTYGQGALPPNSFFETMTLELLVWKK